MVRHQTPIHTPWKFYVVINDATPTRQQSGLRLEVIFDIIYLRPLHLLAQSSDQYNEPPPQTSFGCCVSSIAKSLFQTDLEPTSAPSPYSRHLIDVSSLL